MEGSAADSAKIRTNDVRKQKTDQRDAALFLDQRDGWVILASPASGSLDAILSSQISRQYGYMLLGQNSRHLL